MSLRWESLLGRLFPVGEMSNFWPMGQGLPPSPIRENLVVPAKKVCRKFYSPHLAKPPRGR